LLQLSICSAGPARSTRVTAVASRNSGNIQQRVARNDGKVGQDYLKTRDADPLATTLDSVSPTTESFSPVVEPETKIQDEISSVVLPVTDEPAVPVSDVDHSSVAVDAPIAVEFQDVVEPLPVEVLEITPEVEDPSVDLRIVDAEPLIVAIPAEGPVVPAVVEALSEPVDVPLVDAPVSVTTVSPAFPIFLSALLPLEPVESPEVIPEKVEISPSEAPMAPMAPIYLPVQSPVLYQANPMKSELSSHFPSRPFGSLPRPRELGFPPVSNTRENVIRDVNWHAKLGRAYRSSWY
jgi:hypothetical protein